MSRHHIRVPPLTAVVPPFDKGGPGGDFFQHARVQAAAKTAGPPSAGGDDRRGAPAVVPATFQTVAWVRFYGQKPIGKYIVDFHAPAVALVIEVDGGQQIPLTPFSKGGTRSRGVRVSGSSGGTYGT